MLAVTAAGLAAIGRPSNVGGVKLLAELARAQVPADRRIIWMGENDQKPDGKWPGRDESKRAAQRLADLLPEYRIGFALPPGGVGSKDARDWLTHIERADAPWADCGREFAERVAGRTEVLAPTRAHPVSVPVAEPLTGPALDALCRPFFTGVDPDCGCGRRADFFLIRRAARPRPPAPSGEADRAKRRRKFLPRKKIRILRLASTPADAGRVVGEMYSPASQHISDDAAPAESTPAPPV